MSFEKVIAAFEDRLEALTAENAQLLGAMDPWASGLPDGSTGLFLRFDYLASDPLTAKAKAAYASAAEKLKSTPADQQAGVMFALEAELEAMGYQGGDSVVPFTAAQLSPANVTRMLQANGTIDMYTSVKTMDKKPLGDTAEGRL